MLSRWNVQAPLRCCTNGPLERFDAIAVRDWAGGTPDPRSMIVLNECPKRE